MATVSELSAPYENFMLGPRRGPNVCVRCLNLTDGYDCCYACTRQPSMVDVAVPISYSVAHEQLHHALASYKRLLGPAGRRLATQLAAVLWRFLAQHERCLASAIETQTFRVVTTVPSSDSGRDDDHPLRWIVAQAVGPTRERYERLLRRSNLPVAPHHFAYAKYEPLRRLASEPILLIDDTWTAGANAQSAAAALKAAGAGAVAALVIGRHVNRDWHQNDQHLQALPPFDWRRCALCGPAAETLAPQARSALAPGPVPA